MFCRQSGQLKSVTSFAEPRGLLQITELLTVVEAFPSEAEANPLVLSPRRYERFDPRRAAKFERDRPGCGVRRVALERCWCGPRSSREPGTFDLLTAERQRHPGGGRVGALTYQRLVQLDLNRIDA